MLRVYAHVFGVDPLRAGEDSVNSCEDRSVQSVSFIENCSRKVTVSVPEYQEVTENNIAHVLAVNGSLHRWLCRARDPWRLKTSSRKRAALERAAVTKFRRRNLSVSFRLVRSIIGSSRVYTIESQEMPLTAYRDYNPNCSLFTIV